ncbi:MAG: Mur ligase domain-containing protein [Candidatus Dojkabacteria bacterium]|nr:Mur ligase domain-containing protein [Candidatus Dojkabacteria bacterium]
MKNLKEKQKWFHATGVCGHATAAVTKMFKDMGWFTTGSDISFNPPAVDILDDAGIHYIEGYHYTHLTKEFWEKELSTELNINDKPDLALIVESATSKNNEYRYAKINKIDMRPYSQILGEYLIKDNSIVVAGSAGKTSTTSLIEFLLEKLDLDPSYMIGGTMVDNPGESKKY